MTGVLVIDDDPAVVDLLVEELAAHHAAAGETSPRAGIERAVVEDFDIVITDVEMPGLRGTELLAELLDRKPGQLVLMITRATATSPARRGSSTSTAARCTASWASSSSQ